LTTETTTSQREQSLPPKRERTVRDATFDVLRKRGLTRIFANPGSTEIPFLTGLPDDFEFVLALHEGSVLGLATGYAIGRGQPSLALLHTTAGLGNGVSAIATARVNRAPVVILVGQQDRRHLAYEPFLAGRLSGLAGEYPVLVEQPIRPQDVPAAIERATHAATTFHGPAIVIVPMDDWQAPADEAREPAAAVGRVLRAQAAAPETVRAFTSFLADAVSPAIVVSAGADDPDTWRALADLAERLVAPVYQGAFEARAGFPQDHPLFAGFLPADRAQLRKTLAPYDSVLVVGGPAFRQQLYAPGRFTDPDTRIALITGYAEEAHRSPAELTAIGAPAPLCRALADSVAARTNNPPAPHAKPAAPAPPAPGEPLQTAHVLAALSARLPAYSTVLEEAPVDRPDLHAFLPAREPLGYLSAAQGGLGFALPAAMGLRMAMPDRPIVAIVGDGSAVYQIMSVWSAAHYRVGALFIVLSNGGYAIMDRLAEQHGGAGPWPSFKEIELASVARGFGCPARRITTQDELESVLDEVVPTLGEREEPLLLDVVVAPTGAYAL
jgi:benzoylformate decarboxylase